LINLSRGLNVHPKRWHRAVASHSRYEGSNWNAFSRYIDSEDTMRHTERKSFELPCGKTVAESWGALRKAWLGFKIALANHDAALMTHYASFIRKVQIEMGIQVTEFDLDILVPDILDEPVDNETERMSSYAYQKASSDHITDQELDYDSIMENARSNIDDRHEIISAPRQNIFGSSLTSPRNACLHSRVSKASKAKLEADKSRKIHVRRSCIYIPPGKKSRLDVKIESLEIEDEIQGVKVKDDDCFYTRSNSENGSESVEEGNGWQDEMYNANNEKENSTTNRRHSCSYERKR
jgi:isopentenyldiphosphate isomerase